MNINQWENVVVEKWSSNASLSLQVCLFFFATIDTDIWKAMATGFYPYAHIAIWLAIHVSFNFADATIIHVAAVK